MKLNQYEISSALRKTGGSWLGSAREWMQRKFLNGESVTWGSSDELKPPSKVLDIEEIALFSAVASLCQFTVELNDMCSICTNKNTYPWRSCKLEELNCSLLVTRAFESKKCSNFELGKDHYILKLDK